MNRVVFSALAVSLWGVPPAWADAPCVTLEGDAPSLAPVAELLRARGISVRADCAFLIARVDPRGAKLSVVIDDGDRRDAREVADRGVAASLIESWARTDLAAPLLAVLPAPVPAPILEAAEAPAGRERVEPIVSRARDLSLSALGVLGGSGDGSLWYGALARARTRWGTFEPAVSVRVLASAPLGGSAFRTGAVRTDAALLAGLELPRALGAFSLRPGAALGLGLLRSARASVDRTGCTTAECVRVPVIQDGFVASSFGARADLYLNGALQVSSALSVELELLAAFAPFASAEPLTPTYALMLPPSQRAKLSIAGEPSWSAQAALGLRWEGP